MTCGELMTPSPTCCQPAHTVVEVAEIMQREDVGLVPVVEESSHKLIGVLTDRDIVCRLIAKGKEPTTLSARDAMSSPVVTVTADTTLEDCARLMEQYQVRRLPVIDENGRCCAMVAQADLAIKGPRDTTMEVVSKVSEPNAFASSVGGPR